MADPGEPLHFLDQTEARRAEKSFFGDCPPLCQGLDDLPPPLLSSEGLDPPLAYAPAPSSLLQPPQP